MKIIVDYDLCESNARCMDACPEVFRIEDNGDLTVLNEEPPEELRHKVEDAVLRCPRNAIRLDG